MSNPLHRLQCPRAGVATISAWLPRLHPHAALRRLQRASHVCDAAPLPASQVDPRHFAVLAQWHRGYTMETVLTELRKEMASHHNRRLNQPAEGTNY